MLTLVSSLPMTLRVSAKFRTLSKRLEKGEKGVREALSFSIRKRQSLLSLDFSHRHEPIDRTPRQGHRMSTGSRDDSLVKKPTGFEVRPAIGRREIGTRAINLQNLYLPKGKEAESSGFVSRTANGSIRSPPTVLS